MDLEVRHLRLVAVVAEQRSLTRAGEILHLTQSALSHQLRDLESRLGTRLFYRVNRRMSPTPAGERLLTSARGILADLEATEAAIRGGLQQQSIPLRISMECYTGYHWLPPVLAPFKARFPSVDVRIDAAATRRPLDTLIDGHLDLAVMISRVRDPRLVVRSLFDDEQVLIVTPGHPLASRPFIRPADLRTERLFTYSPPDESRFVMEILQPANAMPAAIDVVQLTEATIELVKAGLGVAVVSRWAVAPHLRDRSVVAIKVTPQGYQRHWTAVFPKHLSGADYVEHFISVLASHPPARDTRPVLRAVPGGG